MDILFNLILPFLFLGCSQACENGTFKNPILDDTNVYSTVIKYQGIYYMAVVDRRRDSIDILRSPILSNFRKAERREIYSPPETMKNIGAPRILYLHGSVYIYFSMQNDLGEWDSTRMYVIQSLEPCNLLGSWTGETRLLPDEDIFAQRATVLQHNSGDLYLIWTGDAEEGSGNHLFIARMDNPLKVIAPRTLLRAPTTWGWEQRVNESPSILQRHGATFLVFSADHHGNPGYCLGIMGIDGGRDPMLRSNWWNDVDHCVFGKNEEESVYGPGHSSFVNSPDDSEVWMVYQARVEERGVWTFTPRIQKLEWQEMNRPRFPIAAGFDRDLAVPSGE